MKNIAGHHVLTCVAMTAVASIASPADAQILNLSVADALFDLDARVTLNNGRITVLDGRATAAANAITGLNATVQTLSTSLASNAAATTALAAQASQVTALDTRVTTQANALTLLGGRVGTTEATLAVQADVLAATDSRVTAAVGTIGTVSGRATILEATAATLDVRVGVLDGRVNETSAAIDRERTRNDQQDGQLAAQSSRIDAVGTVAGTALADTQALRSDVAAGRIGIVQVGADAAITVGASLGGNTVSVAGTGGTRRISGVSAGSQADDAATVGQLTGAMASTLGAANLYTDQSILRALDQQMGTTRTMIAENNGILRREMNGIAANGAALAGLPQSTIPGKGFAGVSMGGKGSEVAIALGASKAFVGAHAPVLRAGAAIDTRRGDLTYNAGVGFHF